MTISNSRTMKRLLAMLLTLVLLVTLLPLYGDRAFGEEQTPVLPTFPIPALSEEHQNSPLPNVIVVATGGTLAGAARNGDKTNFQSYAAGTYPMAELVAQLPKHKTADVATYQFGNKGSGGYSMKELYDLSLAVDAALEIYDSAVVTTGTDTMEEIAYFLDLTVRSEKPVVVTGAMRPWDVIGTDGPANLYQAIKVASSGKTKWYGTVIMLNDVIHAAREVTKSNSHRMDTFETPMLGALGYVDDAAVRIYRLNARALKAGQANWATPFDLRTISKDELPLVEIVYNYQEAGGGAIRALVEDGAKGIVTAGTGAGGISSKMSAARSEAIKKGVTFVSTTRTGSGSIYSGGNGIIAGDNLNPQHARIMLMLSLAFTDNFTTMKGWFETVGTQDVDVTALDNSAPAWPVDSVLSATARSGSSITLSWPQALDDGGVAGYEVYQSSGTSPIAQLTADHTTFRVTGLNSGTAYGFYVIAVDNRGMKSVKLSGSFSTLSVTPGSPSDPGETGGEEQGGGESGEHGGGHEEPISFTDVAGHWSEALVKEAIALGITSGYPDGSFKPDKTVSRAEFTVLLMKAMKQGGDGETPAFSDANSIGVWAKNAIAQAVKLGIISGYPDGTFRPDGNISRTEMVVMIGRAMGLNAATGAATEFADDASIPVWAKGAVNELIAKGIVQGRSNNRFAPQGTATRAEAITVMIRMLKS
ncbi:asparaginase domain-containing protein [Paenibacillus paeoniae]|uniref:Asparaginase n=1 Tax=Paenibacillus paeoniae TaxID=2292705 RepID=A0A371PGE1_9BACL|nr:asparaginase domain-containing protein [Paenibacillus paeoniae]REK75002.1 asparaginase [Paenibacillus paeoniae]